MQKSKIPLVDKWLLEDQMLLKLRQASQSSATPLME